MGFSCEFFTYPKYKNLQYKDLHSIDAYLDYERNSWAQEHFSSTEEYLQYRELPAPDLEAVDFYRTKLHEDEFHHQTLYTTLDWWGSNGSFIYDIINRQYNITDDVIVFHSQNEITKLLTLFWQNYKEQFIPISGYISHSFVSSYDEDTDDETITLRSCDGIELTQEDGSIQRIYCGNSEWGTPLITLKEQVYEEDVHARRAVISVLIKILEEVDFETTGVVFCGGW